MSKGTGGMGRSAPVGAWLGLGLAMALVGQAWAAVELRAEDAAMAEGNSGTTALPFSIRRTGGDSASSQVVFQAQTADGCATAASDYVSLPNTTFRMPLGSDELKLEIRLRGDTTAENDEYFVLKLGEALLTGPDPAFSGPTGFPVGSQFLTQHQPVAIAQGDVNGDGRPDIAVANSSIYSPDAAVLLNTTVRGATAPSFSAPSNFPTGSYSGGAALGDLNGDEKPDLVVANGGGNGLPSNVSVLLNTTATGAGSASFAEAENYLDDLIAPCGPADATLGDINGDRRLDLVATCSGPTTLVVLLNNTAVGASELSFGPTSSASLNGHSLARIALADINNDNRPDVVLNTAADPYDGYVVVLLNSTPAGASSASFGPLASFPVGDIPGRVAIGDLNGDGRPDLAVPIWEDSNADPGNPYHKASRVTVLLNQTPEGAETAQFGTLHEYFSAGGLETAVQVDVNGDGRPDLFTNGPLGLLEMYLNATPDGATTPRLIATGAVATPGWIRDMVTADFNADGREDIAMANYDPSYDEASILLNTTNPLPAATDTAVLIARGEAGGTILNDDGGSSGGSASGSSSGGSSSGSSTSGTSSTSSTSSTSGSGSSSSGSSGSAGADAKAGGGAFGLGSWLLLALVGARWRRTACTGTRGFL